MTTKPINFKKAVCILGAGFSVPSKLPSTKDVNRALIASPYPARSSEMIVQYIRVFWKEVFGYTEGGSLPTLEDHFTALDLAANSGHNLGRWTPAMLRALRRMSIHRVFEILNSSYQDSPEIEKLIRAIGESGEGKIVSTNWDIVVEKHAWKAGIDVEYGISGSPLVGENDGVCAPYIELAKLHGSANWHYCDSCRLAFWGADSMGKTSLVYSSFLQVDDFVRLASLLDESAFIPTEGDLCHQACPKCESQNLSARVATFSYQKALGFLPFHQTWERALRFLAESDQWIFLGYSLPSADYNLRNLFKVAQMIPGQASGREIHLVHRRDPMTSERFRQFFGKYLVEDCDTGLEQWVVDNVL